MRSPFWWGCLALFGLHLLTERVFYLDLPLMDSYLDPVLSIPIALGAVQLERVWLHGQAPDYRLSGLECAILTITLACAFELLLPRYSERLVYDPWDFVGYAVGGVLYYGVGRMSTHP